MSIKQSIEVWPPLLTPFTPAGEVDFAALDALVDFNLTMGVTGLLVTGLSAEPFQMTPDERDQIIVRVVARVGDRIPIAAGVFDAEGDWVRGIHRVQAQGADCAVLLLSSLAAETESDAVLLDRLQQIVAHTDGDLGIYEAPAPYKRLIDDTSLRFVVESGRFSFFKDTCQDLDTIKRRLAIAKGSRLKLYNAEMASLRTSVTAGAAGFCGLLANIYPQLISPAATLTGSDGERLNRLLTIGDAALEKDYPASAKHLLTVAYELDLSSYARRLGREVNPQQITSLIALNGLLKEDGWLARFP